MNPLDYCYNALGVQLRQIPRKSDEFRLLKQYMNASGGGLAIYNIFAIKR
jgi:hypothetical protein